MKREIATYDYKSADGRVVSQTIRYEPKSFSQRRLVNGHYAWGLKAGWYEKRPRTNYLYPVREAEPDKNKRPNDKAVWLDEFQPVLYRLPEVTSAIQDGRPIFIVEGEKDADNLSSIGLVATCCPMGAGKWRESYTHALKGCSQAFIVADKDDAGRRHAKTVAEKLNRAEISVKVLELPDRNGTGVKDFSDWLEAGGTTEEFENLCSNAEQWYSKEPSGENPPDGCVDESYTKLIAEYGQPYYLNSKQEVSSLNESFWAGLYFHENIILYEPEERTFYLYDNHTGLYKQITDHKIKYELSKRILKVSQESGLASLEKHRKNNVLSNIIAHLKGIAEKRGAFNKGTKFVHVGNGMIVFHKHGEAELCKFSPEYYSRNQCPISYNPDATCPRFLNEFLLPAVAPEDAVLIQKYAGLCLLGKNLIQKLLLLDGEGGRGKSTLCVIIQNLIGRNNVKQLRTNHLSERFELFEFLDKTLLIGVDVRGNFLSEKGAYVIKGLVGGDFLDAEKKGGTGSFQIKGDFCIIITSNSRLQIRLDGDVEAWRRRLLIVRFESPPPVKQNRYLADELIHEEGSGILNWALEGLKLALQDIYEYGDIKLEGRQRGIVDALMAESDSVRHFLKDIVVNEEGSDLTVNEIVEAYAVYCPERGWNPKPITDIQAELKNLMLELYRTTQSHSIKREGKNQRGFRGVSLKSEDVD